MTQQDNAGLTTGQKKLKYDPRKLYSLIHRYHIFDKDRTPKTKLLLKVLGKHKISICSLVKLYDEDMFSHARLQIKQAIQEWHANNTILEISYITEF